MNQKTQPFTGWVSPQTRARTCQFKFTWIDRIDRVGNFILCILCILSINVPLLSNKLVLGTTLVIARFPISG